MAYRGERPDAVLDVASGEAGSILNTAWSWATLPARAFFAFVLTLPQIGRWGFDRDVTERTASSGTDGRFLELAAASKTRRRQATAAPLAVSLATPRQAVGQRTDAAGSGTHELPGATAAFANKEPDQQIMALLPLSIVINDR